MLLGRRDAILARRRALQIRSLAFRRENYRGLARTEQGVRAQTPRVKLEGGIRDQGIGPGRRAGRWVFVMSRRSG